MSEESIQYISKIKDKPWYISEIFQKDQDSHQFTKDALLYQDILKYCYEKPSFKRSELDNWLVRSNTEFINDYKDLSTRSIRYSKRIHNKKGRIDRLFNNLTSRELITKSGTKTSEKHKKLDVDVYSRSKLGELIWLAVRSMNLMIEIQQEEKRSNNTHTLQVKEQLRSNNHSIYQLIISMLVKGEDAPYKSVMLKVFFEKLKSNDLFGNFVNHLIEVCDSTNTIYDIALLLSYVLNYVINEAYDRNLFIDLWYESANELDSDSKSIFLYETKLNIEQKVRDNIIGYTKEYEKQWFASRVDYQKIVLEGNCEKCKQPSVVILSHAEHKKLVKNSNIFDRISRREQKFDCKHCNSKDSCVFTTF